MEFNEQTEPTVPRPPAAEIDRVYHDLATVLSDAGQDADGRCAVGQDALRERLKSVGHSRAAIDWAVHLFCEVELLRTTFLKEKQVRTIRPGVSEAKARTVYVPAVCATEEFWGLWKTRSFSPRQQEVILLVHGIRTFASWHPMVKRVLEEVPNTKVIPIKYGYLDAFRFWFPFFTRQAAIDDLRREIGNARAAHQDAHISVIAHSFGTYAVSRILVEHPDIKLHWLILSGAIIPRSYRWNYVRGQLATDVVNDYGTRDIWPVLAKCLSWGYGDTGRHGFGRGAYVTDRGHDYAHSDFFNEQFVREYWKPCFETGTVVPSPWAEKAPPPSWGLSILSVLPIQWFFCGLLVCLIIWLGVNAIPFKRAIPSDVGVDPTSQQQDPQEYPDTGVTGMTTLLSQEALRNEVVPNGNVNEARLRTLLRDGMQAPVANFNPNQHRQCLVSLSNEFGHDYKTFSMDVAIRVEPQLELRKADAYLVRYADGNAGLVSRILTVDIPEINNHTGTLKLDNPKAGESLLLFVWVGTERDDLDLTKNTAGYYMLTLTKSKK